MVTPLNQQWMKGMHNILLSGFFSLVTLSGFSQTGPGGVGDSTSNGLWLRADAIVDTNNTTLKTWLDYSNYGNNAFQNTANRRPLYLNSSAMNGMPVVRFDGSNDEMTISDANVLDGTAGITLYAVLRPNNLNAAARGILGKRISSGDVTNYSYCWFFFTSDKLYADVSTQNNRFNTTAAFANSTNYILALDFNGALVAAQRSRIYNGGAKITTATEASTTVDASNQNITLGALNTNYGTYLGADYAEVIHFNYSLDTVEHILVSNYLSAKYNIALTNNDLYDEDSGANGDYDFDVAGIGRINAGNEHNNGRGSGIVRILNPTDLGNNEFMMWGHDGDTLGKIDTLDVPAGVEARFRRVYRVSEVNSSGTGVNVGDVDVQFDMTGFASVNAADLVLLIDSTGDGQFADETPISGATSLGSNIFEFAGVTNLVNNVRFTLGTSDNTSTPLPIKLLYFVGSQTSSSQVKLEWATATERNNDFFTVERRSSDGEWKSVAEMAAAGNSSRKLVYRLVDKNAVFGTNYYRLKQTDFDGNFVYSGEFSIEITESVEQDISIYPNPAQNEVTIAGSDLQLAVWTFKDALGSDCSNHIRLIEKSDNQLVFDLSQLHAGLYVIQLNNRQFRLMKY